MTNQNNLTTISVGRVGLLEKIRSCPVKEQHELLSRFDKKADSVKLCNDLYDGDADDCGLGYPASDMPPGPGPNDDFF